ncbi:hypothetical protein BGW39_000292 [Mortierella sp. 14UC]|nr:hypothetical protein BGW39_000292 [Mortierella sp. 14UC]
MSGLSSINSVPTSTANPNANANAPAAGNEQIFDARNVNVNRFRVGGFQSDFPAALPENFVNSNNNDPSAGTCSVAEGDVDGPTPTTNNNGATGQQQGQEEEDEGELSDDEKVRRQRQRQWAAMVASGEIQQPDRIFARPGHKITLPVEKPK